MPSRITTTSFTLLGLLDRRPFSAYELTAYMQRSALSVLWSRTEASIYREPKLLEAHGLVTSSIERTGARRRSVYEITAAGRAALRAWLAEPADIVRFECEGAVKAFFADAAPVEQLRSHLERLAEQPFSGRGEPSPMVLDNLLSRQVQFPDRIHVSTMAADLITRLNLAVRDWAEHWLANTSTWVTTEMDEMNEQQARAELHRMKRVLRRRQRDRR